MFVVCMCADYHHLLACVHACVPMCGCVGVYVCVYVRVCVFNMLLIVAISYPVCHCVVVCRV